MKRLSRNIIAVSSLVVLSTVAVGWFLYRAIDASIKSSVVHKSAKTTTATVVSIAKSPRFSGGASPEEQSYKICFTLDGLGQDEPEMRSGYESAENRRKAREGPRCKVTNNVSAIALLKPGDKIQIVYLLENNYQIDIIRIKVFGVDLGAEGVTHVGSSEMTH